MKYQLFIDDDACKIGMENFRSPPINENDWLIARSSKEAIEIVNNNGLPYHISFDHDLGENDISILFINYMIDHYYDEEVPSYVVHSQNPIGAKNIISKMESWKKSKYK